MNEFDKLVKRAMSALWFCTLDETVGLIVSEAGSYEKAWLIAVAAQLQMNWSME